MPQPLFDHIAEIELRVSRAESLFVVSDFDGTLAPLVDFYLDAQIGAEARTALMHLSGKPNTKIAIVSGRSLEDVRRRVGMDNVVYSGNHGLEIRGNDFEYYPTADSGMHHILPRLALSLTAKLSDIPNVLVENKTLTLSVHVRRAPPDRIPEVELRITECLHDMSKHYRVVPGDMVYEVRPNVVWNKGLAAIWIRDRLDMHHALSICIGDDRADEDIFTALSAGITIHVGTATETAAQYQLYTPADVGRFLRWLAADHHQHNGASPPVGFRESSHNHPFKQS